MPCIRGMQNVYHQKMTPYQAHPDDWLEKIKCEGIFIEVLYIVGGFIILLLTFLGV